MFGALSESIKRGALLAELDLVRPEIGTSRLQPSAAELKGKRDPAVEVHSNAWVDKAEKPEGQADDSP